MNNTLTALKGVRVGHATRPSTLTGCTLVLFDKPYPVAYSSYGGSPGTYNTDCLKANRTHNTRDGIFISGGSYCGLTSAASISDAMIADKVGGTVNAIRNPRLCGAVVLDLGTRVAQFDHTVGREAYESLSYDPVMSGDVGAGTGTSSGKMWYAQDGKVPGTKTGVGSARIDLGNGIFVCALSVVNALGNITGPDGKIIAGNRLEEGGIATFDWLSQHNTAETSNTTISIVGTNADIEHGALERIAHLASHGHVRAIKPAHMGLDGDTIFVFSTREIKSILNQEGKRQTRDGRRWSTLALDTIGQAAADAVQESIYDACRSAKSTVFADGLQSVVPSMHEL